MKHLSLGKLIKTIESKRIALGFSLEIITSYTGIDCCTLYKILSQECVPSVDQLGS